MRTIMTIVTLMTAMMMMKMLTGEKRATSSGILVTGATVTHSGG